MTKFGKRPDLDTIDYFVAASDPHCADVPGLAGIAISRTS